MSRRPSHPKLLAFLLCLALAPVASAQGLAVASPSAPSAPTPPPDRVGSTANETADDADDEQQTSSRCVGSACTLEHSGENAGCEFGSGHAVNNNATHLFLATAATYTLVTGFDQCATGEWWQEYRGVMIVQHAPGLRANGGVYTIDSGSKVDTQYFVLLDTAALDLELRWMGTQTAQDETCTMTLAAKAPVYQLYRDFPCAVPPPDAPKAEWGSILP